MELSAAFQLIPEQSTAALIVHHPAAKYYTVRGVSNDTDGVTAGAGGARALRAAVG